MWTWTHFITLIPSLIIFVVISILLRKWLKNKSENIRVVPIHIITVIIVILEIIKQFISIRRGYNLAHLPLYYCSLFLYLYPLTSLCKGKLQGSFRTLTMVSGVTLIGAMMVIPNVIYNETNILNMFKDFFDFHTVVYHNLVMLGTMIIIALELVNFDTKKDTTTILIFYTIYCIVAAPMAIVLKANFNQFIYNTVKPIENIRLGLISVFGDTFGQIGYMLLDMLTTVGFSVVMYFVLIFILKLFKKVFTKN